MAAAGILLVLSAQPASATWSIVAADTETQEVVVASATCVENIDLASWTPAIVVGKGGGVAQAAADSGGSRRLKIFNRLNAGYTAQQIIDELVASQTSIEFQQHGVAESMQGSCAAQTGIHTGSFAWGVSGCMGTVSYSIQGNVLTGEGVITMIEEAFVNTPGDLPAKAMAAMAAARAMGGDGRCSCGSSDPTMCGSPPPDFAKSAHVGYLIVSRVGDTDDPSCNVSGCADGDYFMNLKVADQTVDDLDPVRQLETQFNAARSKLIGRPDAIASNLRFDRLSPTEWRLRVVLRDWRGDPIHQSVADFSVDHAPGSDMITAIESIIDYGDGIYDVMLSATAAMGVDVFTVTADDGIRPVVLPPRRATLDVARVFNDGFESGDTAGWSSGSF